jgi:cell division protein FtsB
MTFIHSEQRTTFSILLIASIIGLAASVFALIIFYNQTVDFRHGVAGMKSQLQSLQAANAALKDKISTMLSETNIKILVQSRGLVEERSPKFFEPTQKWAFASGR